MKSIPLHAVLDCLRHSLSLLSVVLFKGDASLASSLLPSPSLSLAFSEAATCRDENDASFATVSNNWNNEEGEVGK